MLDLICQYLHNWFDRNQKKWYGNITLSSEGEITVGGSSVPLKNGQYFRIVGSALNDGVYGFPASGFKAEEFNGAIWAMAVPPAVVALAQKIEAWQVKYGGADSTALSPFVSESFGGYSYSKGATGGASGEGTWQSVFAGELNMWRKLP